MSKKKSLKKRNKIFYSRCVRCWLLILLPLLSSPLLAHQQKEAVTRVIFNERTQSIEIIHRFLIHDAEHAAKKLFGKAVDIIDKRSSQQQFSNYVIENFSMHLITGTTSVIEAVVAQQVTLLTVGFEIDDRFIWIYQETPIIANIIGLSITHNALRDIWSVQVNLVNIERAKNIRSLIFKGSLGAQQIIF